MRPQQMQAQPRCTFLGEDEEGKIAQCGRWDGHPDEHMSRKDVTRDMFYAICQSRRLDPDTMARGLQGTVLANMARQWYKRLVLDAGSGDGNSASGDGNGSDDAVST